MGQLTGAREKVKMIAPKEFLEKYSWDGKRDEESLIIRAMCLGTTDEIITIMKTYETECLREIYLRRIGEFVASNRTFWKLMLDVTDEEYNRALAENPRAAWNMPPFR